jgi:hypothetical protein
MRTKTEIIIGALRVLANDIQNGDGVTNATIAVAVDRMEELCSELLFYRKLNRNFVEAGRICAQIYIARNISLSENDMVLALVEIDKLYREKNYN